MSTRSSSFRSRVNTDQINKDERKTIEASIQQNTFKGLGFTSRHYQIIFLYGIANLFRAVSILISPAFYPKNAEEKGASTLQIGLVFSAQDASIFIVSLFFGMKLINKVGPQRLINLSFVVIGLCCIAFGCTVLIENKTIFLVVSIIIRIITGGFDAGIYPSLFTIYSIETPNSVSTGISLFEVFFGVGAMAGPPLCGYILEDLGLGFTWTYFIVGSCIIASSLAIFILVPKIDDKSSANHQEASTDWDLFLKVLTIPIVLLVLFSLSTASASIGFISASLALHYGFLNATQIGALFTTNNVFYTLSCPLWGYAADHKILTKTQILIGGASIIAIAFSILGPLPFLDVPSSAWTGYFGSAIHGIGIAPSVLTSYHHALESAVNDGFPDSQITYSIVSSLYVATFSFGNAVGPTVSGYLRDQVGFRWGTIFIIVMAISVIFWTLLLKAIGRKKGSLDIVQ